MGERLIRQALRALVFALLLPLAFTSGLPMLARVLHGPATHVCHCEMRGGHSTCACPICHAGDPELTFSDASIRGRCGDEDVAFGAPFGFAVVAPAFRVSLAPLVGRAETRAPPSVRARALPEPSVPPPRSIAV
jgi:hypothetical protein